jgi:hypothetical protein
MRRFPAAPTEAGLHRGARVVGVACDPAISASRTLAFLETERGKLGLLA